MHIYIHNIYIYIIICIHVYCIWLIFQTISCLVGYPCLNQPWLEIPPFSSMIFPESSELRCWGFPTCHVWHLMLVPSSSSMFMKIGYTMVFHGIPHSRKSIFLGCQGPIFQAWTTSATFGIWPRPRGAGFWNSLQRCKRNWSMKLGDLNGDPFLGSSQWLCFMGNSME